MGDNSDIEWTDATWNPTVGCTKISPGCKHCYAEVMHRRLTEMGMLKYAEPFKSVRPWEPHLNEPLRWKQPRLIFVNSSMSDLFHEDIPLEYLRRVFAVMEKADHHRCPDLTSVNEDRPKAARVPPAVWADVGPSSRQRTGGT